MNVIELLRKAVAELKEDGWTQGTFHDESTGKHCALGAVEDVLRNEFGPGKFDPEIDFGPSWFDTSNSKASYLFARAEELLNEAAVEVDPNTHSIINLNDRPGTKFSDVRSAFTRAIQLAKANA